jgi:hypothetical protein
LHCKLQEARDKDVAADVDVQTSTFNAAPPCEKITERRKKEKWRKAEKERQKIREIIKEEEVRKCGNLSGIARTDHD